MSETKVITGKVRFSYAHVFEAVAINEGDKKKYSVAVLIPKTDKKTIAKIEAAVKAATEAGKTSKFGGKIPPTLKKPLRDGDAERPENEEYAGHYFINASSQTRPGILNENGEEMLNKEDFYSGCYGLVSLNFYPFNSNGSKGIAAGLNNIKKTDDGEKLGSGRSSAQEDFEEEDLS